MLRKKGYIAQQKIRFKRWSNRGCAILLSLKHEVSIAILSAPIADAIGRKSNPLLLVSPDGISLPVFIEPDEEDVITDPLVAVTPKPETDPARLFGFFIDFYCPFGTMFRNGFFYACLGTTSEPANANPPTMGISI